MEKSIKILRDISNECHSYTAYYKFNRSIKASEKYRDGRIDASNWINELICYFIEKEKSFINEFKLHIKEQKNKISILNNCDYKTGQYDQLCVIERKIDDRIN